MRDYPPNSPEAIARLLTMFMLGDGEAHDHEFDVLDQLHVYDLVGIGRKQFIDVFRTYCNDISDDADQDGAIHLIDRQRVDRLLEDVTERHLRVLVCALAIDLCKADEAMGDGEVALLQHMMRSWNLTLANIESEFVRS